MSMPHTGQLTAEVRGLTCSFDGDTWETPEPELTRFLNDVTRTVPKHHYTINEVASAALRNAGLQETSKILSFTADEWDEEIPDDAID